MKTIFPILLLTLVVFIIMACSASKNRNTASSEKWVNDTLVTVHADTVVMFDPKTYQETMTVRYRYDTTIVRKEK